MSGRGSQQRNTAHDGSALYAVQHGNQYIYNYAPGSYWVGPIDEPASTDRATWAPSYLLAARSHIVPFHQRPHDADVLREWRDDLHAALTVQLVHGAGGEGKSRLARWFAQQSQQQGWTVLTARHGDDLAGAGQSVETVACDAGTGLLLVVDYAERWPLTDLLTCLRQHAHAAEGRIRALLLARSAGGWWGHVTFNLRSVDGIFDTRAHLLTALAPDARDRARIYLNAHARFVALLAPSGTNDVPEAPVPVPPLEHDAYGRVLDLHMRALADAFAAVQPASASAPDVPANPTQLTEYLLGREREAWHLAATGAPGAPGAVGARDIERTVALSVLNGPCPHPDATHSLEACGAVASSVVDEALAAHAKLYPPVRATDALEPLRPDRVAEDLLALMVPGHQLPTWDGDMWAHRLLDSSAEIVPDVVANTRAMTVLIEAAARWPHLEARVSELLDAHPDLMYAAGPVAMARFAAIDGIERALLVKLEAALSAEHDSAWDVAGEAMLVRIIAAVGNRASMSEQELADLDDKLAQRRMRMGDAAGALAPMREAARNYRALARSEPVRYRRRLGGILYGLGAVLAAAGEHSEALEVTLDAVHQLQPVAADAPGVLDDQLAMALNNLGNRLNDVGQWRQSLQAHVAAVDIYRALASEDAAYRPELALALNNLGIGQSTFGDADESLASAREAVALYRQLSEPDTGRYAPELAGALANLGHSLGMTGRVREAEAISRESAELRRKLLSANFDAFAAPLASSLNNRAVQLRELGSYEEAVIVGEEAVKLYRYAAGANGARYGADLAGALGNLGVVFLNTSDFYTAATLIDEAVALYRTSSSSNPGAARPELAGALNNLCTARVAAGQLPDALTHGRESVTLWRQQASDRVDTSVAGLAGALMTVSHVQHRSGLRDAALASIDEAVELFEALSQQRPGIFDDALSDSRAHRARFRQPG